MLVLQVFTEKENKQIAALMEKYPDIMIFSDEVYNVYTGGSSFTRCVHEIR